MKINKDKIKSGVKNHLKKVYNQKFRPENIGTPSMGLKKVGAKLAKKALSSSTAKKATQKLKIKYVPTQFLRNNIPGTKGYSAGNVRGRGTSW